MVQYIIEVGNADNDHKFAGYFNSSESAAWIATQLKGQYSVIKVHALCRPEWDEHAKKLVLIDPEGK